MNIFINILRAPDHPGATSDLTLIDVAAGHFAYLEYLSSSRVLFPYVGEISAIAHAAVKKASHRQAQPGSEQPQGNQGATALAQWSLDAGRSASPTAVHTSEPKDMVTEGTVSPLFDVSTSTFSKEDKADSRFL